MLWPPDAVQSVITAFVGHIRFGGQSRRRAVARMLAALAGVCLLALAGPARAADDPFTPRASGPWEARFMTAPAAEVLAAAAAVKPPADTPVVVLFEEMVHTYVDAHRSRHRYRQVYKNPEPTRCRGVGPAAQQLVALVRGEAGPARAGRRAGWPHVHARSEDD